MPKRGASSDSGGESGPGPKGAASDVGRLVDCSQADDRRMIRLVRARPLLYARNTMPVASYYSQVKDLWQDVADDMGWTVAEVRRKWSHMRNSYSRHLRNELYGVRTGKGRIVSRWYLADDLAFLREHMATDTRLQRNSYQSVYVAPSDESSEAAVDVEPFLSSPWFALGQSALDARVKSEPPQPDDAHGPSFEADENAAYFQFFRGIHSDYQELPPRRQRQFRRECLEALHRLLDDEEPGAVNLSSQSHPDPDDEQTETKCEILPH